MPLGSAAQAPWHLVITPLSQVLRLQKELRAKADEQLAEQTRGAQAHEAAATKEAEP